jgi:hypothetical protein
MLYNAGVVVVNLKVVGLGPGNGIYIFARKSYKCTLIGFETRPSDSETDAKPFSFPDCFEITILDF